MLKPGREGIVTGLVRQKRLPIGPVLLQGPVEPFGLAVLPGAVRPGLHVPRVEERQRVSERVGEDVVLGVVGHHGADRNAMLGEERRRRGEERRAGGAFLVGQDLSEREPRVVIDGDVDVVETQTPGAIPVAVVADGGRPIDPPPAAVRDPKGLLKV